MVNSERSQHYDARLGEVKESTPAVLIFEVLVSRVEASSTLLLSFITSLNIGTFFVSNLLCCKILTLQVIRQSTQAFQKNSG